jgi:parallel beta-helix repeat protein
MTKRDWSVKGLTLRIAPVAIAALLIMFAAEMNSERSMEASAQRADRLAKEAPDLRTGPPVITSTGGPDSYGYRWKDSDEAGGPAFEWNDISGKGTPLALGDDDDVSLSLPFNFYFYGVSQSVIRISSNGFLSFDVSATEWQNDSIPSINAPDDIIAAFWDDLNPSLGGGVYYYHDTGEDEFIVQYHYIYPAFGPGLYTFQIVLRPNSSISFRYLDMQGTTGSATVGIENSDASTGLEIAFNTSYVKDSLAVEIWPLHEVPSNYSTIQDGIDAATGVGDTVLVDYGTYTGAGNKDLTFDGKNIVLMSVEGAATTIIDCQNSGRGIFFYNTEDSISVVDGFTITNGNAALGGGICGWSSAETPTIRNCIVTNCYSSGSGYGGGIHCGGEMTLENCVVLGNTGTKGGGIFFNGGGQAINCLVAGNTASNVGGGISSYDATFEGCTITGNTAVEGGGIKVGSSGSPVASSSSFTNCTISGNTATTYGGISTHRDVVMTNCILWGNCNQEAKAYAGVTLDFYCSDVNSSGVTGPGVINYDVNTIFFDPLFCDPENCLSAPTTAGDYSLAANSPCLPENSPCGMLIGTNAIGCAAVPLIVPDNFATIQLAIDVANPGDTVTVMDGTYTGAGNKNLDFGGKNIVLMSMNGPDFTIIDCEGSGHAIEFENGEDSTSVMDGFGIRNGNSTWGGGIFIGIDEEATIKNCIVQDCVASLGGGIYCEGGGYIENCVILNDSAGSAGGGIWCDDPNITNCYIAGNGAGGGGGISTRGATIDSCTITGNTATVGGGVATRAEASAANLTNCTISGNTATFGGGISLSSGTNMFNCILWGNCNSEADAGGGEALAFFCCDVDSSGVSGSMVTYDLYTIFEDPLFCDPAPCIAAPIVAGEYTIHKNSPCIPTSSPCGSLIGALAEACSSRVFEVGDSTVYPTIQSAIDATSQPGDTVLVSDSTWTGAGNTFLDFEGRNIVLISENGPATTIIDCEGSARGILFENGEDSTAVVDGFTIINGDSAVPGSAIRILSSSPTIRNCIVADNRADSGVVHIDGGSPVFTSCSMQDDTTTTSNGLLTVKSGSPTFDDFVAQDNQANQCVSLDGGSPVFIQSVVQNNTANNAVLISTQSIFMHTNIIGNSGNGMYFTTAPASNVDSCSISRNGEWGIVLDATTSIFNNCDIKQNMGGGLLVTGPAPPPYQMDAATAPMDTCYCSEFTTCDFAGNVNTTSQGGGCRLDGGTPEVPFTPEFRYCTFTGNTSILDGGGIAVLGTAVSADISPHFLNCTISANTSGGEGGGIYMGVKPLGASATAVFDRTILWGNCTIGSNSAQAFVDTGNSVVFNCSNVANYGFAGMGTIDYGDSVTYGLPFFCETIVCDPQGTIEGNFALAANSAASPDSNPCQVLIGAHPVTACDPTHIPVVPELPVKTVLQHCAPNPFNPTTVIQFDLAKQSLVSLRIYDVRGRLVRTLIEKIMPQARHRMTWDGADNHGARVATGVYFLRLSAGDVVQTRKMVLIK